MKYFKLAKCEYNRFKKKVFGYRIKKTFLVISMVKHWQVNGVICLKAVLQLEFVKFQAFQRNFFTTLVLF